MITFETPLLELPWSPALDMRKVMVANALSVINVEAGNPVTRPIFDELLGPPIGGWGLDKPFGAGGPSTCSMAALGLLRWRLDVACPAILDGYDVGTGLRVARDWARRLSPRSAWATFEPGLRPHPGDVLDVKPRPNAKDRSNHTETVIGWETAADGTEHLIAVAGGQVGAGGLQAIHRVSRPWVEDGGVAKSGGREVDGWLVLDLLPFRGPVVVPMGWEGLVL